MTAFSEPGTIAFLVLLSVMAMARVVELFWAKRLTSTAKQRGAAPKREPVFVVMVLLHVLVFVLPVVELWVRRPAFVPALFAVSVIALSVLMVCRVWTLRTLGAMWNVRIVEPSRVVVAGPYRFIRHPNYAVVIAELFFIPLGHGCFVSVAIVTLLNAWVLSRRIPAEEAVLFSLPGYAEQMGKKPRFLPFSR
jgi:methyltransferase